jgi:hypothetical protein
MNIVKTAACLGISAITARRYWAVDRAWFYAALSDQEVMRPEKNPRHGDTPSS